MSNIFILIKKPLKENDKKNKLTLKMVIALQVLSFVDFLPKLNPALYFPPRTHAPASFPATSLLPTLVPPQPPFYLLLCPCILPCTLHPPYLTSLLPTHRPTCPPMHTMPSG